MRTLVKKVLRKKSLKSKSKTKSKTSVSSVPKKNTLDLVKEHSKASEFNQKTAILNKQKSKSISAVIDKLKTPLGSMRWNTEKILKDAKEYNLPAEVLDLIKKNYQSNLELLDLVETISTHRNLKKERFSIPDLIKEIIEDINTEAKLKKVSVRFRVNKGHRYFANMDRKQIKEALKNIIHNAVKYSFQDSQVLVSLNRKEKFFEIKTSNMGIGIPNSDNEHIFQKFYRANNATELRYDGLGLGLFIAKSFIEKIDGSISLFSSKGKRTIFIVRIPIAATR